MEFKSTLFALFVFMSSSATYAAELYRWNLIPELHPTQAAVGLLAVEDKRQFLKSLSGSELRKYLLKNPVPVVKGPNQYLFMVDHHHLVRALQELKYDRVIVAVIADFSDLDEVNFWNKMLDRNFVYLFDENGKEISPYNLPNRISDLKDDIYRSLSYFVREMGGYDKTHEIFAEFSWAEFYRSRIPKFQLATNWKNTLARAVKLAHCPEAKDLPGFVRGTCGN